MRRRTLLQAAGSAAACSLAGPGPVLATDAEIELAPAMAGPAISPHLYGHFIEHLGGVIYDGIWVAATPRSPTWTGSAA